jgi:hypothetical protein
MAKFVTLKTPARGMPPVGGFDVQVNPDQVSHITPAPTPGWSTVWLVGGADRHIVVEGMPADVGQQLTLG